MQLKEFNFDIDVKRHTRTGDITIVSDDYGTNVFNMTILSDGSAYDLTGITAEFVVRKSDGTTVQQTMDNGVSINGGVVTVVLSLNAIAVGGITQAEVRLLEGSNVLTSSNFEFFIRDSLVNADTIESTDDFPILSQLITTVEGLVTDVIDACNMVDGFVSAEDARVVAETNRVSTENARVNAELSRVNAEASRVGTESARVTAESNRVTAEGSRTTAEDARVVAEGLRVTAEDVRATAEGLRATAEDARVVSEGLRVNAEDTRVTAEGNRVTTEGLRVTAEDARVVAEGLRVDAEDARVIAEADRVAIFNGYDNRITDIRDELISYVGYNETDIYGIEWDVPNDEVTRVGASKSFTRADFDTVAPWNGIKRCILTDDRVVLAYYGETGFSETGATAVEIIKNGVTYPIGTAVQVMVEIPQHYYRVVPLDLDKIPDAEGFQYSKMRLYISDKPYDGFKQVDKFYYSAYEGSIYDVSASAYLLADEQIADFTATTGDKLCSIASAKPCSGSTHSLTRTNSHIIAQNRGTGWQIEDFYLRSVVSNLMLVEYATFDMQTAIGTGVGNKTYGTGNEAEISGQTSSIGNASGMATGTNGLVSVSYRGVENFWNNIWTWTHGLNIEGYGLHSIWYAFDNFTEDIKVAPYKKASFTLAKTDGYISKVGYDPEIDFAFLPTETLGASNKCITDYFWQNNTYSGFLVARFGGYWYDDLDGGARCLRCSIPSTYRYRGVGARLCCKI